MHPAVLQKHGQLPLAANDDDPEFDNADKADVGWEEEDRIFKQETSQSQPLAYNLVQVMTKILAQVATITGLVQSSGHQMSQKLYICK